MRSTIADYSAEWQSWCEFREATLGAQAATGQAERASASERELVQNLLHTHTSAAEKAVWLRSLVELCGLTIRQVSGYFNIQPQVVVQAISLLEIPLGFSKPAELPKRKRRRKAA